MFVSKCLNVNEKGHLTIGGVDTVDIAGKYGTPVIVYDENAVRDNCRAFVRSIDKYYGGNGRVLYASKAFSCLEMCRICSEENMGLDVVSGGEIYTALKAGFPADRMYFHGNNKSEDELKYALENNVGRIVVDNPEELKALSVIAKDMGKTASIYMRIKPGIDAHTHNFIRTGQIDSKFGFALETGEAMECVKLAAETESINLVGLHCHIGSQIFDIDPFVHAAQVMMKFIADIKSQTGIVISELDLGGGFGIKYTEEDKPAAFGAYMEPVSNAIKASAAENDIPVPFVLIEPGRSIAGAEAVTLYTVGAVKHIPNVRTYVSIDGGMTDNPRYILYQSAYTVLCANKADKPRDSVVTVAGKCCESGDLIQENASIQTVERDDILAVLSTGAYNYSMASNYNRVPRPAVLMVKDGNVRTIINRESYEDMVRNDI
ncbi:MAG: diaminopimelate decarboxylase [Clostridiales bacterium]|nr:diaminopimelate decarboxylase [Clostridiales bacterium]